MPGLHVGLACGDQRRPTGNGSALEVVLHDYALYKSTFTLLYFTFYSARPTKCALALYTITVDRESCVTCDVTPKTIEQNRIVRTNKSETEVTNNRKLRSSYCTIEATKLTTDRHEASRGLFATAELLV